MLREFLLHILKIIGQKGETRELLTTNANTAYNCFSRLDLLIMGQIRKPY